MKYERFFGIMIVAIIATSMMCFAGLCGVYMVLSSDGEWYWKILVYQCLGMGIWILPKHFLTFIKELMIAGYEEQDAE